MKKSSKKTQEYLSDRDKRLRKKYGITEAEYNYQLDNQEGGCYICGRLPGSVSLHVDHDHRISGAKIYSERFPGGWKAWEPKTNLYAQSRLKTDALRMVRESLKRRSVRGILCWPCNSALKKFNDDIYLMQASANYLREYLKNLVTGQNGFQL